MPEHDTVPTAPPTEPAELDARADATLLWIDLDNLARRDRAALELLLVQTGLAA